MSPSATNRMNYFLSTFLLPCSCKTYLFFFLYTLTETIVTRMANAFNLSVLDDVHALMKARKFAALQQNARHELRSNDIETSLFREISYDPAEHTHILEQMTKINQSLEEKSEALTAAAARIQTYQADLAKVRGDATLEHDAQMRKMETHLDTMDRALTMQQEENHALRANAQTLRVLMAYSTLNGHSPEPGPNPDLESGRGGGPGQAAVAAIPQDQAGGGAWGARGGPTTPELLIKRTAGDGPLKRKAAEAQAQLQAQAAAVALAKAPAGELDDGEACLLRRTKSQVTELNSSGAVINPKQDAEGGETSPLHVPSESDVGPGRDLEAQPPAKRQLIEGPGSDSDQVGLQKGLDVTGPAQEQGQGQPPSRAHVAAAGSTAVGMSGGAAQAQEPQGASPVLMVAAAGRAGECGSGLELQVQEGTSTSGGPGALDLEALHAHVRVQVKAAVEMAAVGLGREDATTGTAALGLGI